MFLRILTLPLPFSFIKRISLSEVKAVSVPEKRAEVKSKTTKKIRVSSITFP
jgi:hypothetical protein